ncbi:Uncharacterized protein HZ326_25285 [Fusarium oxysporum f. sp. albedinis]|nr:Uncharacterized protein HZ326_25285 [Fusarium oxysporum f. sp. albedinis]
MNGSYSPELILLNLPESSLNGLNTDRAPGGGGDKWELHLYISVDSYRRPCLTRAPSSRHHNLEMWRTIKCETTLIMAHSIRNLLTVISVRSDVPPLCP